MASYDVLIVDDDPYQAHIVEEVVGGMGFSSRLLLEGARAFEEAKRAQPRLIVLDIIMPGADGLALCMKLKPELAAWGGRVLITSGKDRAKEEQRALRAGASGYLQKPYRVKELRAALEELLGTTRGPQAAPGVQVVVKIWGSRGPGQAPAGSAYGTRTPCVSAGLASGEIYIMDAGTGIRECSAMLLSGRSSVAVTLLLTHYHPAHIEGLAGLPLLTQAGHAIAACGPMDPDTDLEALFKQPDTRATVKTTCLEEKSYRLTADTTLGVLHTSHPTTTLAFSLQTAGKKIVYCPDADLPAEGEVDVGNNVERLRQFATGADLLVLDAYFLPEDHAQGAGQGHSSWPASLRLAVDAGARRLCLFHAAAHYSDEQLAAAERAVREAAAGEMSSVECMMAKDGLAIEL